LKIILSYIFSLYLIFLSFYTWSIYHRFFLIFIFCNIFLVFPFFFFNFFLGKKYYFFIFYILNIYQFIFDLFISFLLFLFSFFVIFFNYIFLKKIIIQRLSKCCFNVTIVTLSYFFTLLKISMRSYIFFLLMHMIFIIFYYI